MRWALIATLTLVPGCYLGLRGQTGRPGGAVHGDVDLALSYDGPHQDGQIGMSFGDARVAAADGQSATPTMTDMFFRYAHAVDDGGHWRLFGRAGLGGELCEEKDPVAIAAVCDKDKTFVLESSFHELAAGLTYTAVVENRDRNGVTAGLSGWSSLSAGLAAVYSHERSRERGSGGFTGVELSLSMSFDPFAWYDQDRANQH